MILNLKYIAKIPLFVFLLIAITLGSCKTKKTLTENKINKNLKADAIFEKVTDKNQMHEWYSFVSDANVYFDRNNMNGKVDVRMQKDKVIWMSIRKFGFEISRILLRPDSVFVLNRFHGEFYAKSLNDIKEKYKIPLDFEQLQELLATGVITKGQVPVSSMISGDRYLLKTTGNKFNATYEIDAKFNIVFVKIISGKNSLEASFDAFKPVKNTETSFIKSFFSPNKNTPRYFLKFKIKKVIIDKPLNIKFEIPQSYERS